MNSGEQDPFDVVIPYEKIAAAATRLGISHTDDFQDMSDSEGGYFRGQVTIREMLLLNLIPMIFSTGQSGRLHVPNAVRMVVKLAAELGKELGITNEQLAQECQKYIDRGIKVFNLNDILGQGNGPSMN